ncbi:MAG: endosialidase [Lachnospirales bacterium]
MAVIEKILQINDDNTLSFGNYVAKEKQKISDVSFNEDLYKCKTHTDVTRLEKNEKFLIETVPGATIHNFNYDLEKVTFNIEGYKDTKVTVELLENQTYTIIVEGENLGIEKTNMSGKLSFSRELLNSAISVEITKRD